MRPPLLLLLTLSEVLVLVLRQRQPLSRFRDVDRLRSGLCRRRRGRRPDHNFVRLQEVTAINQAIEFFDHLSQTADVVGQARLVVLGRR